MKITALFLTGWTAVLSVGIAQAGNPWGGCESLKPLVTRMGLEPVFSAQKKLTEFKRPGRLALKEEQAKEIYYSAQDIRVIQLEDSCLAYKNLRSFDCAKRISYVKELHQKAISSPAVVLGEIFAKSPAKVLMVGESHYHMSGIAYISEVLKEAKRAEPRLDCLFVEVHAQHQSAFDLYADGKISTEEMIEKIRKEGGRTASTDPAGGVDTLLTQTARELGVKVIPVDRAYSYKPGEGRDAHMAQVMSGAFERMVCTRAMFRVGKEHLKGTESASSFFCKNASDCMKVDMMLPDDSTLAQEECPALGHKAPPAFSTLSLYPVARDPIIVLNRFFLEPFKQSMSPPVNEFDWLLVVPESN